MRAFPAAGPSNTAETIALAVSRARDLGLGHVLVATTSGRTAVEVAERAAGLRVVAVTHSTGFSGPGTQELDPASLARLRALGVAVLTTTHAFGGVGRSVRRKFKTYQVEELIAQTLKVFGEGTKVAVEICLMAADAGLVPVDRDVLALAGTSSGADTALVVRPAHAQDFFDLRVKEIVCKPAL